MAFMGATALTATLGLGTGVGIGFGTGLAAGPSDPPAAPAAPAIQTPLAPPQRVVSLNLCTDQMALLLGAPGQVVSLSKLIRDPRSATMVAEGAAIPVNDGSAEAVVLLQPDLVLAGTWTTRATIDMLERLEIPVALFPPANSFADARANIARMGRLLGRDDQATALLHDFDTRLTRLGAIPGPRPRSALYLALGNIAGTSSLAGDILNAAGMDNIAHELDLPHGGALPLEALILTDPDLILVARPYNGHARATELLAHPVLNRTSALRQVPNGANWICAAPALLDAVEDMVALRQAWAAEPQPAPFPNAPLRSANPETPNSETPTSGTSTPRTAPSQAPDP